jgi:putative nucleotidyltransferase with HDIG domain
MSGFYQQSDGSREEYISQIYQLIDTFPAMPTFVSHVVDLLHDPNANAQEIAERIKFDPGMTANILKLANSAQFGSQRRIGSLQEAIVRLGLRQLFQMVVSAGIAHRMTRALPGYELRPDELLRHSVWAAVAASELCEATGIKTPDLMFTAGLLHDLGKLILDDYVNKEKGRIEDTVARNDMVFDSAESDIIGMNHAEVGSQILDQWRFPDELISAARWHHHPEYAEEHATIVIVVHIADALAYSEGVGCGIDGMKYELSSEAINRLGLKKDTLELVASQTLTKMQRLEQLLKQ